MVADFGGAFSSFTRALDTFGTVQFPGRATIEQVVSRGTDPESLVRQGVDYILGRAGLGGSGRFGIGLPTPPGPKSSNGALSRGQSRPDPLMSWHWEALVPGIGPEFIEDLTIPQPEFESEATFRQGSRTYYAKFADVNRAQLRLYVDTENTAINWLYQSFGAIRNPDGTYNYPSQYKKRIDVHLLDPNNQIACRFSLLGCWPVSGNGYELQSASNDRLVLAVEMSVDDVELHTPQAAPGSSAFFIPALAPSLSAIGGLAVPLASGVDTLVDTLSSSASSLLSSVGFKGY